MNRNGGLFTDGTRYIIYGICFILFIRIHRTLHPPAVAPHSHGPCIHGHKRSHPLSLQPVKGILTWMDHIGNGKLRIDCLYAGEEDGRDRNEHSLMLLVTYDLTGILLTGDMSAKGEARWLNMGETPRDPDRHYLPP